MYIYICNIVIYTANERLTTNNRLNVYFWFFSVSFRVSIEYTKFRVDENRARKKLQLNMCTMAYYVCAHISKQKLNK